MRIADIAVPTPAKSAFQVKPCTGPHRGGAPRESVTARVQTPIRTDSGRRPWLRHLAGRWSYARSERPYSGGQLRLTGVDTDADGMRLSPRSPPTPPTPRSRSWNRVTVSGPAPARGPHPRLRRDSV